MEAAFTLGFGQFDDPDSRPGVAHLTEHLLLSSPGPSGSESLESWLEARDGDSNGLTTFDNALFTVSSGMEEWESALSRFAYCFRQAKEGDARFQASATQREVLRVDSELQDGLSLAVRNLQLLRCRAAAGHSFRAFGQGSLKTLLPNGQRNSDVEATGKLCKSFFMRHARATTATLAIVAAAPLEELERAAAASFQDLPAHPDIDKPRSNDDPFPACAGGSIPSCFVVDVPANPAVCLTWSIPFAGNETEFALEARTFRASKPHVVLAHLISHQGPGSLSAWLKTKRWTPDSLGPKVSTQTILSTESGFALLEIKVRLSSRGLASWREVVSAVLGLLAALRMRRHKRRDVLREAVEEVSALADVAWRFPPRPPLARELAVDMRTAPRPAAYVSASRRIFAPGEWESSKPWATNLDQVNQAARFTSASALEACTEAAARLLQRFVPEAARITLCSTAPQAGATARKDPDLGLQYGELKVTPATEQAWLSASMTPAEWWQIPAQNNYLSQAGKIVKPSLLPGMDMGKPTEKVNGVYWSDSCRPHVLQAMDASAPMPKLVWNVPGCIYVSGQFNELVVPLGEEPLVTMTLWFPAVRVRDASVCSRAAGRLWLKSLQRELESPFFSAALAGCRWEVAFFEISKEEAGMRLCFQGYSDNLTRFAPDAARAIVAHQGPSDEDLEVVRSLALAELKKGADSQKELLACLEEMQGARIHEEAQGLWESIRQSMKSSQALVAGAAGDQEAISLVRSVMALLPTGLRRTVSNPAAQLDPPPPRPPPVLTRRPSWQGGKCEINEV